MRPAVAAKARAMAANVEIKARVPDLAVIRRRAEAVSDASVEILDQEDVFFNVSDGVADPGGAAMPGGRLKLRILGPGRGELILYHRTDVAGPKTSNYRIAPTSDPAALRGILTEVLGVRAVVRKRRWLYHVGQTRVHLDQVAGLGEFVELEVVLRAGQSAEEGTAIARGLMQKLDIAESQLVGQAYVDLLVAEP
jgi:predicted adenylyl cyclase CyaB